MPSTTSCSLNFIILQRPELQIPIEWHSYTISFFYLIVEILFLIILFYKSSSIKSKKEGKPVMSEKKVKY